MAQVRVANDAFGLLNASMASGDTSFTLQAGQGARFPQITGGDWFYVTLTNASNVKEVCKCTALAVDTFTVTRGVDGTSASTYTSGTRVELRFNAAILSDLQAQISSGIVGPLNQYIPLQLVMIWIGSIASIPAGWQICDGTNGSPNLKDRFVVGAGNTYATGATGGATTATLGTANLPSHTHTVVDNGHTHTFPQSAHTHGVNDPTHYHSMPYNNTGARGTTNTLVANGVATSNGNFGSTVSGINIGVTPGNANVSINIHQAGLSVNNTGSGTPFSVMPPYLAYAFICKTATWS